MTTFKAAQRNTLWFNKQHWAWSEVDTFTQMVKFLQHPAFPLWEEKQQQPPGAWGPQLSGGAVRSRPTFSTSLRVNSRPCFSCRPPLGHFVLYSSTKCRAKGQPGSRLLICRPPYCLPLLFVISPRSSFRHDRATYFYFTFGPRGQPLPSSIFKWVGSIWVNLPLATNELMNINYPGNVKMISLYLLREN